MAETKGILKSPVSEYSIPAHAAIYLRVSSQGQVEKGLSLVAQKKACVAIAERNGWTYEVYADEGISAAHEVLDELHALREVLSLVEEGKVEYVVTTEIDRLSRNENTLLLIKNTFAKNNVKVQTLNQLFDFNNGQDQLITTIFGAIAQFENWLKSTRVKRAMRENVKNGKWHGGIPAFGYNIDRDPKSPTVQELIIDPDEARVYRKMVRWCIKGMGTNTIARKLNIEGIPTKGSKLYLKDRVIQKPNNYMETRLVDPKQFKWKAGTVLKMLRSPLYKGERHYLDIVVKAPAIIKSKEWDQLQSQLTYNYNNAKRNTKRFYLLKGLLRCKKCGRNLFGLIKPSRGMRLYSCSSKRPDPEPRFCGMKNINLDRLNELVWSTVRRMIVNSKVFKKSVETGLREHEKHNSGEIKEKKAFELQLEQIQLAIHRMLKLYGVTETMTAEELDFQIRDLKQNYKEVKNELDSIEKGVEQLQPHNLFSSQYEIFRKQLAFTIDELNEQEQSELLHLVLKEIYIDYEDNKGHKIEIVCAIPVLEEDQGLNTKHAGKFPHLRQDWSEGGAYQSPEKLVFPITEYFFSMSCPNSERVHSKSCVNRSKTAGSRSQELRCPLHIPLTYFFRPP